MKKKGLKKKIRKNKKYKTNKKYKQKKIQTKNTNKKYKQKIQTNSFHPIIMSRREKAFVDPIYLLGMQPVQNDEKRVFYILGASGNEYTVTISNIFTCTCPDYQRRHTMCKHLFFVFLRVCKCPTVPTASTLPNNILQTIFANIPEFLDESLLYSEERKASKGNTEEVVQKIDDFCPICLEDLTIENPLLLTFCKYSCGKSIHINCFQQCMRKKITNCMFCRKPLL